LARALQNLIRKKNGDFYEIVSIDDFLKMSNHETILRMMYPQSRQHFQKRCSVRYGLAAV
ncbi:MAG: hypothetical protein Q4D59_10245, partial [Erysipelotrichaceae bacterium]|nr:hypothetical protein [Erysipelotrichaceae bacterium]